MKVLNSNVSLESSHSKQYEKNESESLKMWDDTQDPKNKLSIHDRLELSKEFQGTSIEGSIDEVALPPKLKQIILVLEALTGHKIDVGDFKVFNSNNIAPSAKSTSNLQKSTDDERLRWGINYSYHKQEIYKESTDFSANGYISTENGTSFEFSFAMNVSKELVISESKSFKAGDALIDPLVINYGSNSLSISQVQHSFDLDLDGKSDTFNFVAPGSGFLALDKNKDSKINDGSELFGPKSGNGFFELSKYDSDNNHWIDENDSIYNELLIWTKDENGIENLYSLKDKNIGAIYLESVSTPFEYMNSEANTLAKMKESSVYLKENGEVGTLSEIDLAV